MLQNKNYLHSELITFANVEEAIKLQNSIFPRENAKKNFLDAIKEGIEAKVPTKFQTQYFLVKDENNEAVGLWGHYIENRNDECWLGWFGVKNEMHKKGYGTQIFKIFENWAKENGFKTIRLYTDEVDNAQACVLYENMGMIKEYYKNSDDITKDVGDIVIYSKSLTGEVVDLWNNKFINIKGQKDKEEFYKKN